MHHRDGQRQALADAQRQIVGHGVEHVAQAKTLDHFVHPRGDVCFRHGEQMGVQHEVLMHRQFRIQREPLRHIAHAPARGDVLGIDLVPKQRRAAFAGRQQAGQHLHGGGFAAAVGADETEDLAPADAEIDVVNGDEIAEAHGEIRGLDGDFGIAAVRQRRNRHGPIAAPLLFRQQGDEGRVHRVAVGAFEQFGGRAGGQHLAGIHRHQPVEALRLVHVGGGHDHAQADTLGADVFDQVPELRTR